MSKIVLITGASSGIGKATANLLNKEGFVVYGGARRIEKMEDLKKNGIRVLQLDVTDEESVTECVNKIISEEGKIDVLINNAGYGFFGSLEDVPMSEAKRQFEVNLFGLGRITQLVLPHMRKQKSGKIINISSIGGKIASPFGGWYQSSKFAVEGLSDTLRMDVKRFGIDVVIIEPAAIESEWASIARDNLLKVSSDPYLDAAKKRAAAMRKSYKNASDPIVIAKVIKEAITAKSPRTRYVAGKGAGKGKMLLLMRSILPDKQLDWIIKKMVSVD
jgi:NADP-dependent 3-hydroxy acid dehydrogenase YdfG